MTARRWFTRDPDKFLPTAQVQVVLASDYDALLIDAGRYRWLRDWHARSYLSAPSPPWVVRQELCHDKPLLCGIHTEALDAAIDEAASSTSSESP
jgi:hypothetical protein